jgi:hypothetical protein
MPISFDLRRKLLTLPPEERQELADDLYESLVDESLDSDWQREWSKEIEQRMSDVADGRVELIDADPRASGPARRATRHRTVKRAQDHPR